MRRVLSALLGLPLAASLAAQTPATPPPAATPAPHPIPVALDYDSVAFAHQLTAWFYAGEADSLWAHSDSGMQAQFPVAEWRDATLQFATRGGTELSVVEERWVRRNGHRQYWRVINASNFTDAPLMLRFALAPGRKVMGVGMNPANQAPTVDPN